VRRVDSAAASKRDPGTYSLRASIRRVKLDIHLNPREEGHDADGEEVPIRNDRDSFFAPKVQDLFEQIYDRYRFRWKS